MVFNSRTLRKLFVLKKAGITGGWRELCLDLLDVFYSPNFIRMIRSEDGIGGSSCTRGREYEYLEFLWETPKERELGRPRRKRNHDFKMALKVGWEGVD